MHYPLDELLNVVDELANEGVKEISLLGGDPATHPNIFEIVEFASSKGLIISSLSNTHNYKNSDLNAISKYVTILKQLFIISKQLNMIISVIPKELLEK